MNSLQLLPFLSLFFLFSCTSDSGSGTVHQKPEGLWKGVIHTQNKEIPFGFEINKDEHNELEMNILNAGEKIRVRDLQWEGDTLMIPMHIFDSDLRAVVNGDEMQGFWIKNYVEDYKLPFTASKGKNRFDKPTHTPTISLEGKWAVNFEGRQTRGSSMNAIALFQQEGTKLMGTILTPTGDYRYLEGVINNKSFTLSSFDGENAYLFEGETLHDNNIKGTFWSGKGLKEEWSANRDELAALPHQDSLTYLKEGYDKLHFTFPNLNGRMVSLDDPQYRDKVIIVQILGSWCPNCMDETRFLANWYRENKDEEIAIIGLAYEKKDDFEYASRRIKIMADKLGAEYDFLIAGTPDRESTSQTLPMLNQVMSFPTTIFIDKKGRIRRIHTGFYGPGTGDYYLEFVKDFKSFTNGLMQE